jgi:hypothetical protein
MKTYRWKLSINFGPSSSNICLTSSAIYENSNSQKKSTPKAYLPVAYIYIPTDLLQLKLQPHVRGDIT